MFSSLSPPGETNSPRSASSARRYSTFAAPPQDSENRPVCSAASCSALILEMSPGRCQMMSDPSGVNGDDSGLLQFDEHAFQEISWTFPKLQPTSAPEWWQPDLRSWIHLPGKICHMPHKFVATSWHKINNLLQITPVITSHHQSNIKSKSLSPGTYSRHESCFRYI